MPYKSKTSMPHKRKTSMPHKRKTSMPHKRKTSMPHKRKTLKRKASMIHKRKTKKGGSNSTTFKEFMKREKYNLSTNYIEGFLFQSLLKLTYIPMPTRIRDIKTKNLNLKFDRNDKNLLVIKSVSTDESQDIRIGDIITEISYSRNSYPTQRMTNDSLKNHFKQEEIILKIIRPFDLSFNFDTKKFIFTGVLTLPTDIDAFNKLISVFINYNNNNNNTKLVDGNFFEVTDIKKKTYFHNINNNYIKLKEFVKTIIKGINIDWNKTDNDGFDIILTLQNEKAPILTISQDLQTAKYNKPTIEFKDGNPSENKSDIMISHLRSDNLKKLVSVLVLGNEQKGNFNNNIIQLTGQTEANYNIYINNKDNINEAAKQLGLFTDKQIEDFNKQDGNPFKVEKFTDSKSSPYKDLNLKYEDEDEIIGHINDKKTIVLYTKMEYYTNLIKENTTFFTNKLGMENIINISDYQG